ncbi:hypothetical protein ACH5RR_036701 [Cinchona calisaya]|uniref:Uncharacterized protein n=1 Tax=Cinchona calisaya TaxID=153742 RepID=A0ABD2Y751_9GENT
MNFKVITKQGIMVDYSVELVAPTSNIISSNLSQGGYNFVGTETHEVKSSKKKAEKKIRKPRYAFQTRSQTENSPSLPLKHVQKIQLKDLGNNFKVEGIKEKEEKLSSDKEPIIHEALLIMTTTRLWLFGFMISSLCSDVKPYFQMRKVARKFYDPSLKSPHSMLIKEITQKQNILNEVREVNDAADELVADITHVKGDGAAEILSRRLEFLRKMLQGIGKQFYFRSSRCKK